MPYCPVYDMEWDLATRRLVAGTHARSVMSFPMDSLDLDFISGRPEPPQLHAMRLAPNPAHASTRILSNTVVGQWEILDASGRTLRQGSSSTQEATLSLEDLPHGMYFVRATHRNQRVTQRLLIQ